MVTSGVQTPRLRLLTPVLNEWISVVTRVTKAWRRKDVPFWYNERAQVGLFAGAVWLQGGLAFEEYTSAKRGSGGRCDLWFEMKRNSFIAEAKFTLCPVNADSDVEPFLTDQFKKAKDDARRNKVWQKNEHRIALLFVAVEVSADAKIKPSLVKWRRQFEAVEADGRAWVFPTVSREFKSGKAGNFYPGCGVLVAKV